MTEQVCKHFTDAEISDLRKLLDQIQKVAEDDSCIASKIGYRGNEVVITQPQNVNKIIQEGLDVEFEADSDD